MMIRLMLHKFCEKRCVKYFIKTRKSSPTSFGYVQLQKKLAFWSKLEYKLRRK